MSKLLGLMQANIERGKGLTVKSQDEETHIYLYDAIGGWWGVEAQEFVKELNLANTPKIILHINCPGGDVFDARAMMTAIKQHKSEITAQIDGLCASAATFLSTACAKVTMAKGSLYMIHEGWTLVVGNKSELIKTADLLKKVDDSQVDDFRSKTGQEVDQISTWMREETWFTAEEAKEYGFVDEIIGESEEAGEQASSKWNLSAYENAPKPKPKKNESLDQQVSARLRRQREVEALSFAIPS